MSLYRAYFVPGSVDPRGKATVVDPKKFGGGKVPGGGTVSVSLGVAFNVSDAKGKVIQKITDGIKLQFDNKAGGCKKCCWLQFFWVELHAVQVVIDKKTGKKKAQQTPIPGKIVTSAVPAGAVLTTDPNKKVWYVDSSSKTEPCAGLSTGTSKRTNTQLYFLDRPGAVTSVIGDPANDQNLKQGLVYLGRFHFESYLVCSQKSLYQIKWDANSSLRLKAGKPVTSESIKVIGGGPSIQPNKEQIAELKRKYPKQKVLP